MQVLHRSAHSPAALFPIWHSVAPHGRRRAGAGPALQAEISFPGQAQGDAIVEKVAAWSVRTMRGACSVDANRPRSQPNLSGAMTVLDGKKLSANFCGRSYDRDLHKRDYEDNKGHGRHFLLACSPVNGQMQYLDANFGNRHEAYNYPEYDLCRQLNRQYWLRTQLAADPSVGRAVARWVDWTGIGDSAYNLPVHNGWGAPRFYVRA